MEIDDSQISVHNDVEEILGWRRRRSQRLLVTKKKKSGVKIEILINQIRKGVSRLYNKKPCKDMDTVLRTILILDSKTDLLS